ncbi:MAG: T9SS type A sorting domain-containing protein [Lentisphaeria bacterium]|nr:T9SS type A sorting domain-containing protein [Candidatus Neomarinimicrobiota bacterium]MCF7842028.1 T9SS type A sorting domain-containing protein [Lentisphaeria bacterium]
MEQLRRFTGILILMMSGAGLLAQTAPVAFSDTVTTQPGIALDIILSASDADGDALTYSITTNVAHGMLTGTAPDLTYTPDANFMGEDSLIFSVSDGSLSATGHVFIQVLPDRGIHFSGRSVFTDASGPEMCGAGANAYMEMVESGCDEVTEGFALSEDTDFLSGLDSVRLTMGGFMLEVDSFYCIAEPWGDHRVYSGGHAQILLGNDTLMRIDNITMTSNQDYMLSFMEGTASGAINPAIGNADFIAELNPQGTNEIQIYFTGANQVVQGSCGLYDFDFFLIPDSLVEIPNLPPTAPILAEPFNAELVSISEATLGTELTLMWHPATDPDGDELEYLVELAYAGNVWTHTIPDTVKLLALDSVYSHMAALDQDSLSLRWQVKVTDGVDTVAAVNGPFFTIFAHWDIHAENIQISFSDTNSAWYLGDTLTISAEITNAGPLDFNHPVGLQLTADNPLITLLDSAAWLNELSMGVNQTLNFRAIAGLGLAPGTEIEFALTTEAQDCASEPIPMCLDGNAVTFQATVHEPVVSIQPESIPTTYALGNNYPNPFNPSTTIRFALPEAGAVKLVIYDVQGKPVRTLLNRHLSAGHQSVVWQGQNDAGRQVSTGVYFARLEVNGFSKTRKMILMK